VPIVTQTIAEHRVYLPLAGPVVLLVAWAVLFAERIAPLLPGSLRSPGLIRRAPAVLLACIAVALAVLTWQRNADYRTPLSIWRDTVQKRPDNARARRNLAEALWDAGDSTTALHEISRAISLEPDEAKHYYDRGTMYLNLDRLDEAFADLSRSLKLKPAAQAFQNRGLVYCRRKQFEPAIADFDQALQLNPHLLLAWRNRAMSHFYLQHFELARRDINQFRARGGDPDNDLRIVEDFLNRI
jgi:tetratricopeptide (TPR) repeat protein